MLAPTSIETTLEDHALMARHEHCTIRIEVVPPDESPSANGAMQAVVRIVTDLPAPFQPLFAARETIAARPGSNRWPTSPTANSAAVCSACCRWPHRIADEDRLHRICLQLNRAQWTNAMLASLGVRP